MPRNIRIYSTLSKEKEVLNPQEDGHVKMYACGVTVYDENHIGHAMQAIFFDVIRNYMEYAGYRVTYVRNYTDVDDKIIERASLLGISPKELSESIIASSEDDLNRLGVKPANHEPRVSESIEEIISMTSTLIEKGYAYACENGDVYYKVRQNPDYGKLSRRKIDELEGGKRSLSEGSKADELDFALWKADKTEGASWKSPWGQGRPGWHIECSAMAKKFLGSNFDIHGGGLDLVFPHHENEIAQSECANGSPYANIWIHSGLLTVNRQKMSKSTGNFITIKTFLQDWAPEVLRLGYLQHHYSSNIDFSTEMFAKYRKRLFYYYETLGRIDQLAADLKSDQVIEQDIATSVREEFHAQMSDNFKTPSAIACINNCMRQANQLANAKKDSKTSLVASNLANILREIGAVLGLLQDDPIRFTNRLKESLLPELGFSLSDISSAIDLRKKARAEKQWQESDAIREKLEQGGIILQDLANGECTWTVSVKLEDE